MADVNPTWAELLPMWLTDHAKRTRKLGAEARDAYKSLTDKSTPYAKSIKGLIEAHDEAEQVYRRRQVDAAAWAKLFNEARAADEARAARSQPPTAGGEEREDG